MINLSGASIGRYHILEPLGEGGMAVVYKALDTRLQREVAVKVIRTDAFPPAVLSRVLQRFEREALTLARLTHPNIIPIHDYGEHDGAPYLVMPYLTGGTLKERLTTPIPYAEAAALLAPVARALEYAHEQGVLHRDIKPSNILITAKGQPMLGDFGIAKLLEESQGATLTGTNIGVGTPEYMAPEAGLGKAEAASDQYSLGVVFYEMITGRKPYTADTPFAVMLKHNNDPLVAPGKLVPGLPKAVEQVIFTAMAKQPQNRYPGMADLAAALEKLAQAAPAVVTASAIPPEIPRPKGSITPQDRGLETRDELEPQQGFSVPPIPPPALPPKPTANRGWLVGAALAIFMLLVVTVWWLSSFKPAAVPINMPTEAIAASTNAPSITLPTATNAPSSYTIPSVTEVPYNLISLSPDIRLGTSGDQPGQFSYPRQISIASDGTIYIADSHNNRIQHLTAEGNVLQVWGTFSDISKGEAPGGTMNEPWGVAVSPDRFVFVADTWNHRIQKFTAEGQFIKMWGYFGQGEMPEAFWGPRGIWVDQKGLVYVADTGNKRVVVFDENGNFIAQVGIHGGGSGPGEFNENTAVAVDEQGFIYITDTWNQRVQVLIWDTTGKNLIPHHNWKIIGWNGQSNENKPFIAVNKIGQVFVTDPEVSKVLEFVKDGTFVRGWSVSGQSSNGNNLISGIAVDPGGKVWVSEAENGYLQRYDPDAVTP